MVDALAMVSFGSLVVIGDTCGITKEKRPFSDKNTANGAVIHQ